MSEIITFAGIFNFFKNDPNCVEKGELKYKSGFVLSLQIKDHEIQATVRASMKDKSYKVVLKINGDGGITSATCECPRGKWLCNHMAASAIYVNKKGYSKTDLPSSWIAKPRKAARNVTKTCGDFFPHTKPEYRALPREVTDDDREFFFDSLNQTGELVPMQWILGPEPLENLTNPLMPMLIEDLLKEFIQIQFSKDCHHFGESLGGCD